MKKFLFIFVLVCSYSFLNAQSISCPFLYKRNNGNNCVTLGTGGSISFKFSNAAPANLQIHTIVMNTKAGPVLSKVVAASKRISENGASVEWCFENTNVPPPSQVTLYQPTFYLDMNLNNQFDLGEPQGLCAGAESSLPVSFKKFELEKRSSKVLLNWETASEMDNAGFEIERKNEAGNFEKIGFLASKANQGTGAGFTYQFEDNNTGKGRLLYRIRQVDYSGTSTYSDVKAIITDNGTVKILAYPNPSKGNFNVILPAGIGKKDVRLETMGGQLVQSWNNFDGEKITVSNLNKGLYLIRGKISQTGESFIERIIVQ